MLQSSITNTLISVKTGEYIDLVESIRLVAEKLPGNVSIEIRINPVMAGKEKS